MPKGPAKARGAARDEADGSSVDDTATAHPDSDYRHPYETASADRRGNRYIASGISANRELWSRSPRP
jgi:hypothetical protein